MSVLILCFFVLSVQHVRLNVPQINVHIFEPFQQMTTHQALEAHTVVFLIGYGLVYVYIFSNLPFNNLIRGVLLGLAGWLAMMVAIMPMMGAGLFGLNLASGLMVPVATLMLHIIFGVVLSYVNSKL